MADTTDLLNFALDKSPIEFGDTFDAIMRARAVQAVEDHRETVARSIYGTQEEDEPETFQPEFDEDDLDDFEDIDLEDLDLDSIDDEDLEDIDLDDLDDIDVLDDEDETDEG